MHDFINSMELETLMKTSTLGFSRADHHTRRFIPSSMHACNHAFRSIPFRSIPSSNKTSKDTFMERTGKQKKDCITKVRSCLGLRFEFQNYINLCPCKEKQTRFRLRLNKGWAAQPKATATLGQLTCNLLLLSWHPNTMARTFSVDVKHTIVGLGRTLTA